MGRRTSLSADAAKPRDGVVAPRRRDMADGDVHRWIPYTDPLNWIRVAGAPDAHYVGNPQPYTSVLLALRHQTAVFLTELSRWSADCACTCRSIVHGPCGCSHERARLASRLRRRRAGIAEGRAATATHRQALRRRAHRGQSAGHQSQAHRRALPERTSTPRRPFRQTRVSARFLPRSQAATGAPSQIF